MPQVRLSFRRFLPLLCLMGAFLLFLYPAKSFSEVAPVSVGAMIHLTGDLAMQGNAFREGIELAIDEVNAAGGIHGHPLQIHFEDTQLKAAVAFTAAKKLVEQDKVVASLVSTLAEAKPVGAYFEVKKTPLICLWDTAPELEDLGDYSFGIGTWAPSTGTAVADFAAQVLGLKTAAVIDYPDEWAISVANTFKNRWRKLGREVVFEETINVDHSDHRAVFTKMISKNPDLLYIPVGANVVALHKQIHDLGYRGAVFQSDNLNDQIIKAAGQAVENVYQTQTADPQGAAFENFQTRYLKKYNKEPSLSLFSAWGYDGIMLLAHVMKKVGSNPLKIKEALYNIQDFPGASSTISISPEGSSRMQVSMYQVQDGKLTLVHKE